MVYVCICINYYFVLFLLKMYITALSIIDYTSIPTLFVLWWWFCIKMANWGRETNLATVQRCSSLWSVMAKFRGVGSCVFVFVWLCDNICMLLNLYFCSVTLFRISVFATMQSGARSVANLELNYGEIMQPTNQPASIILCQPLYQSSKSAVCPMLEKISTSGWVSKYVAVKWKTAFSACIQ